MTMRRINSKIKLPTSYLAWPSISDTVSTQMTTGVKDQSSLRAYQWEGVDFLTRRPAALLADEMGLGKTVQAIFALAQRIREGVGGRVLIVVPAALKRNWLNELQVWAPHREKYKNCH